MLTHTLLVAVVAAVAAVGEGAQTQGFSTSGFSLAGLTGNRFQKKGTSGLFDQKIVGGTQVDIVMRPFVVSISMWTASKKSYQLQCGGSVLDKYHILAAAHCFSNKNGRMYRIRAGSTYWNKGGQVVYGSSIKVHSKYRAGKSYDYDAAVIRLAKPLKIDNRTVKPVSLVKAKTAIKPDKSVTILGWGYTDPVHANPLPDKLRQVTISTIKSSECQDDYTSAFSTITITSRMFCGMDLNGDEKNSCQGDSGGPVIDARTQQQMGIVSWAEGCAQMGSPGVYTDVANAEIRSFINQAIRA